MSQRMLEIQFSYVFGIVLGACLMKFLQSPLWAVFASGLGSLLIYTGFYYLTRDRRG
jgi:hypothetical protein